MHYGYNFGFRHFMFSGGAGAGVISAHYHHTIGNFVHETASPVLPSGGIQTGVLAASGSSLMSIFWLILFASLVITLGLAITRFIPRREQ